MLKIYFYKIEITLKTRSYYKRNIGNQLINLVNNSKICEKVENLEQADLVVTIGDFIDDKSIKTKKKIVYSLQDNCLLNDTIYNNKNVLLVFDHYKVKDITNNYDVINNNRLFYLLGKKYNNDIIFQKLSFNNNVYNKKNKCILNMSNLFKKRFLKKVIPIKERSYDLVFMGNTQYSNANISNYRLEVIKKIINVAKNNNLKYYVLDRPIKHHHYLHILSNSKILVSPYGYGEFSTKDYECICTGTHVLKPKIYFEYYPNFCKNYDDFEIDFSNFESKILDILKNIDMVQKKVDENRNMFLEYNLQNQLIDFEKIIKEII